MLLQIDNTTDDTHVIEWRIINFSQSIIKEGERLECEIGTASNLYGTRWELAIYPKGRKEHPNYLACFVKRDGNEKRGPEILHLSFEFSIVTFDGVHLFKKGDKEEFKRESSFGYPKFVQLEDIFCRRDIILKSDILTIRCKLQLLPPKKKQISHQIYMTKFPVDKITTYMNLKDFRSITKQYPQLLRIRGSKELLSLYVSMNKDETPVDKDPKSANPETPESFLHIVMKKKKTKNPVHVTCWIKLLNTKLEIAIDKETSHLFSDTDKSEEWVLPYFIDTNNLGDDCIENNSLYLDFNFTICDSQPQSLHTADLTPMTLGVEPKETTLMRDLANLHETRWFSDVTLRIGEQTFPAHKSLLAARIPKFREIFKRLLNENPNCENQILDIEDVDKDTMALVLKFIYTDKLDDINNESCLSLYSAAQKYRISSLLCWCARILRKNLSVNEVYKVLLIAEEFRDLDLKMVALDYILKHYQHVLITPEWQAFTDEHEGLATEVTRYVRLKKKQESEE